VEHAGEEAVRNFKKARKSKPGAVDRRRARENFARHQAARGRSVQQFSSRATRRARLISGTIKSVDARALSFPSGRDLEGYLRASEISRDRVEDARTHLKEGDSVNAMIINVDRKNRTINLR